MTNKQLFATWDTNDKHEHYCLGCGMLLPSNKNGNHPKRCDECRERHKIKEQKEYSEAHRRKNKSKKIDDFTKILIHGNHKLHLPKIQNI